jgi:uncharacterized protein (TIGR04222 family)
MNKLSQQELWGKIQNFNPDDPASTFPFSKKLAKENNWSPAFTGKAIEEYKKFIFLCCISPTGASPSPIVDEVWHIHLTYTDNYWNRFCKKILNKEIHHYPSKGGEEKEKHVNWYNETLKLYESVFDAKPPADIWPVNQKPADDIREPVYDASFFKKVIIAFLIFVFGYITLLNLFHSKGPDFLYYYLLLCISGIAVLLFTQLHKDARLKLIVKNNLPRTFSTYQIARFLYGPHRAYQAALVDLLKRGIIDTSGNDYKVNECKGYNWEETNPLLQPLMQKHEAGDLFTYSEGLGYIDRDTVLNPQLERLHRLSKMTDYQKLVIPGIVLLVGFARFLQGISNDKPVGFLVMEMGFFSIVCLMILQMYSYTGKVREYVEDFWEGQNKRGYGNDIVSNFTILGTTAVSGFAEYALLAGVFNSVAPQERKKYSGGSDGCSSTSSCGSDGGSSCGGGCGGCGGD